MPNTMYIGELKTIVDPGSNTPAIDDEGLMLGHTNPQSIKGLTNQANHPYTWSRRNKYSSAWIGAVILVVIMSFTISSKADIDMKFSLSVFENSDWL